SIAELLSNGPLQSRFRESDVRDGACAIKFRLESCDLRVDDVGARRDAGLVAVTNNALGLGPRADFVVGGCARLTARVERERSRAHFERRLAIEIAHTRPQRGRVR